MDSTVIYLFPSCVVTNPQSLLLHHALLLPLCMIPYFHVQYHWHMMIGLTTEINTFFIVIRRQLPQETISSTLCNILFYLTWILFKLILFPCLSVLFFVEYITHSNSTEVSTYMNFTLLAPIIMSALTLLCYKWTYDLLSNLNTKKKHLH